MASDLNPFIESVIRQKIDREVKHIEVDADENRYNHIFSVKYDIADNQILSYVSMPFDYTPELEKKEIDIGNVKQMKIEGHPPAEQINILNDVDVGDVSRLVMFDEETQEIYRLLVKVDCLNEGSFFDDRKKIWMLPLGSKEANFKVEVVKNDDKPYDISNFHEFSFKSMEKSSSYVTMNDEEGTNKIYLPKEPASLKTNILFDNEEQVIRVKLVPNENSSQWLTHYICYKTKEIL